MSYFNRTDGYESDYENMMENCGYAKTDGYGRQHNALAYIGSEKKDGMNMLHMPPGFM